MLEIAGGILIALAILAAIVFGFGLLDAGEGGCGCILLLGAIAAIGFIAWRVLV
jgi:hypothetical protein